MNKADFKVRIFQPLVLEYRVALFNSLGRLYGDRISVHASQCMGHEISCPLKDVEYSYNHRLIQIGPLVWQTGFSLSDLRAGDVVVVCGDIHQISSIWIAFCAKVRGIKVVWWGHHKTANGKRLRIGIRLAFARYLSDVMLTYTQSGARYLVECGFRKEKVFATGNTIDQLPIIEAMEYWTDERLNKWMLGNDLLGKDILLCCSVLREKVRLDLAIRALAEKPLQSNIVLVIIGDGPLRTTYEDLSKELHVDDRIIWVGGTRDQMALAPWFLAAKLFVYPGAIGLSILHSFSYGLPVVVNDNADHQMPEYEVMEDKKTGATFRDGNVSDLANVIYELLANRAQLHQMSEYVYSKAHCSYTMHQMVENFSRCIEAAARL